MGLMRWFSVFITFASFSNASLAATDNACDLVSRLIESRRTQIENVALDQSIVDDFVKQGYSPAMARKITSLFQKRQVEVFRYTDPEFIQYLETLGFSHDQAGLVVAATIRRALAKKIHATYHDIETLQKIADKLGVRLNHAKYRPYISINDALVDANKLAGKIVHETSHLRFRVISDRYLRGENLYFKRSPEALHLVDELVAHEIEHQLSSSKRKSLLAIILKTYGSSRSNEDFLRFIFYLEKTKGRDFESMTLSTIIKRAMVITDQEVREVVSQYAVEWQAFYKANNPL